MLKGGNPVASRTEDRLGRSGFADQLAQTLREASAGQGLVVALVGDWGSGKTSVLNMVTERLSEAPSRTVLTFNPWMFSGTEQLVGAFFQQVAGQLRIEGASRHALSDLADKLIGYGQALAPLTFVPLAGPWAGRIAAVAGAAGIARSARKLPDPVEKQRRTIEEALEKLPEPILVVIDDIDRLTPAEIRSMLGLVRLTAHFPRVIYLLAFDRAKVERALGEGGLEDGRSYLDKIVEVVYDMPAVSQPGLQRLLLDGIQDAVDGISVGPLDEALWKELFPRVLRPLLNTPREVNRYLAPLPAMLRLIGPEVALADVLALEALRVRLPETFAELSVRTSALTDVGMRTSQTADWKAAVLEFTAAAGPHEVAVQELCRLLFPATERYLGSTTAYPSEWLPRWRRECRVASPEILGIYLGKQVPESAVPAAVMEQAVAALTDQARFQAIIDALDAEQIDDLLARLETYEDTFPPQAARQACAVLLGVYPRLRTYSLGFLDPGPEIAVDRVVLRLLRRADETDRPRIVEDLCADVTYLTGRIRMLQLAGRRPNPDYERLIPAADSDRLYQQVCREVRHATATQLAAERDPLDLLAIALAEDPGDREDINQALADDEFAAALLLSATAEVRSRALGNVASQAEQILRWEQLRTVVGDDKAIAQLTERAAVRGESDKQLEAIVRLTRRYLDGWRPRPPSFAGRPLVIRQPSNIPNMIFSPSVISGWPALLVRAATTYEVDPIWANRADVSGQEFHDRLTSLLAGLRLPGQVTSLAEARGLDAHSAGWQPDRDATQFSRAAVQRLVVGQEDQPAAILRYAVFLPDNTGPMKLLTDIAISPTQITDSEWGRLSAEELRDLMAAALDAAAGQTADRIIRAIFGEPAPRTDVEVYLWSAQGQGDSQRPSNTLASTIDLDILGAPTQPDQIAQQGLFAVAGDTPTGTLLDCQYLTIQALIRMALTWGFLDAPARLLPLAP